MPQKSATVAKKKSAVKGLALKEAAVREAAVKSSKTASGKRATRGKENRPPVVAASSSGSVSVQASARSAVPALNRGDTVPTPAVSESHQDLGTVAIDSVQQSPEEVQADLVFARAQLAATRRELRLAQEAARPNEPSPIERPNDFKIGKLQSELSLGNDLGTYAMLCFDIKSSALAVGLDCETRWNKHPPSKMALLYNKIEDKYTFMKRYVGHWPINEFLRKHFSNQRSYRRRRRIQRAKDAAEGKGKARDMEDRDSMEGHTDTDTDVSLLRAEARKE